MSSVPKWFSTLLVNMDPLLSIRRSVSTSNWVIDRKGVIQGSEIETLRRRRDRVHRWITTPNESQKLQIHQNRMLYNSLCDEVFSAEHGNRVIVCPKELNTHVYEALCRSDIKRYGGCARYSTALEQQAERDDADQERMASNRRQAVNAEVYDILGFLERKKGALLDNNEQDLGYMLHGRRTKPGDRAVVTLTDF